jgi:D-beta-D-heptose 7-phosphate kinase/D-beta-D-heptose 1-phosphate adenosyltransferase
MNPSRLQHLLQAAASRRILVVGDVMLDEFVWGRVSRISPEAPVPVVEVQEESSYPGGAANVARNLRPFCAGVLLSGAVGQDAYADKLRELLLAGGIETSALVATSRIPTIVKTRIVARQQQVVRVDREKNCGPVAEVTARACELVAQLMPTVDGVIVEDYGKGFLGQDLVDHVCSMARKYQKFLTADPNPGNQLDWRGVDLLKPNRSEAFAMAGRKDPGAEQHALQDAALLEVGAFLLKKWDLKGLLVTLGEHGMMLFEKDSAPYHTPTKAREVFDVSGAGDTAIALYTLAICSGATAHEAAEISNHASGVVVAKLGTATLLADELIASFAQDGK